MSDIIIRTISDFQTYVCGEPTTELFTVYSLQEEEEVFKGTWEELLNSQYVDIELASWDLAPQEGVLICFNLDDEGYDYYDEDYEEYEYEEDDEGFYCPIDQECPHAEGCSHAYDPDRFEDCGEFNEHGKN